MSAVLGQLSARFRLQQPHHLLDPVEMPAQDKVHMFRQDGTGMDAIARLLDHAAEALGDTEGLMAIEHHRGILQVLLHATAGLGVMVHMCQRPAFRGGRGRPARSE
jgi:hypothetical protein